MEKFNTISLAGGYNLEMVEKIKLLNITLFKYL
jgi:hypothetical protein